jgi:hypothetical protein
MNPASRTLAVCTPRAGAHFYILFLKFCKSAAMSKIILK